MKNWPQLNWSVRRRGWIGCDLVLSAAAVLLAYVLQPNMGLGWRSSNELQPGAFTAALTYPWLVLLATHIAGLHDPLGDRRRWLLFTRVLAAVAGALVVYLFALYWIALMQLGRTIMTRVIVLNVVFLIGIRLALWGLERAAPRKIGIYAAPERVARLERMLAPVHAAPRLLRYPPPAGPTVEPAEVARFFTDARIDEVLVCGGENSSHDRAVWHACLKEGVQVSDYTVFIERELYQVPCEDLTEAWILSVDLKWIHPFYHRLKRLLDVATTLIAGVLSAPLMLGAMVAVKLEDGGPIFYSQIRTGFRGRPYRMWKLRSMRVDAEREGARWASVNDDRVTRIGHILRRTRIDELPQIWNVLCGEMSFIGPRPERPEMVDLLTADLPLFPLRHWTKPGITGWAQINFPYGASAEDARQKLAYDLYYIKHASLLLDLHIVLRTMGAVMKGAR
jgi:exopolysaccharide biosynthesis polyprenyl glycosylphosphotransferase